MQTQPVDGGPIYAESDFSAFVAEPYNAISSLAILFPAVYFAIKIGKNLHEYKFILFCIPLLFLGGLGSTLFHAFRASKWLLWLDVLPTSLLTFSVGAYFWWKILPKWWMTPLVVLPIVVIRFFLFNQFPVRLTINMSYFITGFMIFFPVILYLVRSKFYDKWDIIISVIFLSLALVLRARDHYFQTWLPMGSHFLWHLLSGVGAYFLAQYLFNLRRLEIQQSNTL